MGLFSKIFKHDRESEKAQKQYTVFTELNGYRPVFHSWGGEIYESELVRSAIDARARHFSKLKPEIRGSARPSLQNKMKHAPNEWMTWSQWLYRVSTMLDVDNTCIIVPVYDADLIVTGYYPVRSGKCEVVQYKKEPWLLYHFSHGDRAAVELRLCAILTKFQLHHDFFGDTNRALDETMKLININRQGIEAAVENSAGYSFMAQLDNFSDEDDLENERQRFSKKNLSKDANDGGLLLFPNTYKNIQQIKYSPYTVDATEMEQIATNVSRYFGVNDDVMENKATGDQLDAFFNGATEPLAIQLSEAMTKAMFTLRERSNGAEIIFSANRLQYMATSAKITMAQQLLDRGVMSINEARELFNYPPVENGDIRSIRGEYKNADDLETVTGVKVITVTEEEPEEEPEAQPVEEPAQEEEDANQNE